MSVDVHFGVNSEYQLTVRSTDDIHNGSAKSCQFEFV